MADGRREEVVTAMQCKKNLLSLPKAEGWVRVCAKGDGGTPHLNPLPLKGARRSRTAASALTALLFAAIGLTSSGVAGANLDLALPTDNDALFRDDGPGFYQVVARDFQGVQSRPWEGGQYGFVRDPIETPAGIIFKRFHEGIDIRPVNRDARGEPTDEVRAIAEGKVVHTNPISGFSNYGRFVVVEHDWDSGDFYSLYAHLNSIAVQPGQHVERGERLGIMGHTGEGIDRERSHVHLELNMMLSREFDGWYTSHIKNDPNRHGLYNGLNLAGLDIARLYLALRKQPGLTIPQFLAQEKTFYKVTLPENHHFDLLKRYPWLLRSNVHDAKSWEVSFTQSGLPLKIEPGATAVAQPELTFFTRSRARYWDLTRGTLTGRGEHAALTENGRRWMELLIFPD
jgi:murein DD-endopeptidase MepM/ murein hydrolase activator NlpD